MASGSTLLFTGCRRYLNITLPRSDGHLRSRFQYLGYAKAHVLYVLPKWLWYSEQG